VRPRQDRVLAQACSLHLELLQAQECQVAADLHTTAAVTKSSWAIIHPAQRRHAAAHARLAARAEAPRRRCPAQAQTTWHTTPCLRFE
jgi:hypothetical protein